MDELLEKPRGGRWVALEIAMWLGEELSILCSICISTHFFKTTGFCLVPGDGFDNV